MKITIFGANGRVGSKVVARLLADGHRVTAFIHGPSRLSPHPSLTLAQGDIHAADDVQAAVKDADVVISTLGSWGTKTKDILTSGMQNIIPAMEASRTRRIVSLTGAGAFDSTDHPRWFDRLNRFALSCIAPKILEDGEKHIALLRSSNLDWCVVRSPIMREQRSSGYVFGTVAPLPWATIPRDDVVEAMVRLALTTEHSRSAPFITRQ